jgi:hypothetical protein
LSCTPADATVPETAAGLPAALAALPDPMSRVHDVPGHLRWLRRSLRRSSGADTPAGTGHEIVTPFGFDQAGHRAAGLATLDAERVGGKPVGLPGPGR